jgi:PAS domain S-box-containing protein
MTQLDLQRVFRSIAGDYVVLSLDFAILAVTDSYLQLTRTRREEILGRRLFEVFPANPDARSGDRLTNLQASLERVRSSGIADTLPVQQYDLRQADGTVAERHWRLSSVPVLGSHGEVEALIQQIEDVTNDVLNARILDQRSQFIEARLHQAVVDAEKTAALLADANQRLRLTLAAGEVGTWLWDSVADRVVADANLARMFGVSAADADGGPIAAYMRAIHPDDRARVEREIARSLEQAGTYETEYRLMQSDGSIRSVLARGRVDHDDHGNVIGLPGVVLDVTDRVRAEQSRQLLAARVEQQALVFDTTLSSITDFAYIFDREGRFAYVNQALLTLWGLPLDQAVGKNFFDLRYPDDLAARLQDQIEHVFLTGEHLRDETPYTSPTGVDGYYEYIFAPVRNAAGQIEVVAGSTRDITARKTAERERETLLAEQRFLQDRNAELLEAERAARAQAERVGHLKDDFLATLSHELRTPLNAILGWVQLLTHTERDQEALRNGLRIIERNAQVQKKLIEDLLDMSRIVSGKVRLDVQHLSLVDVVNAAIAALQPAAEAKGITVRAEIDQATTSLWGDENRLEQVLWNLVSNAIKFTPHGGVVQIVASGVDGHVELRVTDTGAGMTPEFLPYAFDRFRQSDASTTREHGGLGLGLAIVRKLVELHGGRVDAFSEGINQGSTFIVSLPQALAADRERTADRVRAKMFRASARLADCDPKLLLGLKVLVVDDEPDGRALVARILEGCAAIVILAASTPEALALVHEHEPDVLVSDIGMPETDGYELMRQVRALRGKPGAVPAAALTGLARPEDRTRALMSGYQTHIAKPVDALELIAAVASLAGRTGMFLTPNDDSD